MTAAIIESALAALGFLLFVYFVFAYFKRLEAQLIDVNTKLTAAGTVSAYQQELTIASDAVAYAEQQKHAARKAYGILKADEVWTAAALRASAQHYVKLMMPAGDSAQHNRLNILIEAMLGHRGGRGPNQQLAETVKALTAEATKKVEP